MKLFIAISIFLLSAGLAFSQDYNKKNRYGQYIGEWIEYYPEGYIKRIKHYTPLEFKPDTFAFSSFFLETQDTIISPHTDYVKTNYGYQTVSDKNESISHLDWVKIFEYDPNWQLKRVLQIDSNHTSTYLYGNHEEIGVVKHEFQLEGIVGNKYHVNFIVHNLSDSIISLRFENLPKNIIASDIYQIPAKTEYDVIFNVAPETFYHTYNLDLIGENILIELIFNTEGYHYKTSDFRDSIPLIIPNRNLVIKRINSEALLTILSPDKKNTIRQISLNRELVQVDLTDLIPGEYIFVFTDFSNSSKFMKKIKLK